MQRRLPLPVRRAREYISGFDSRNRDEEMNGGSMEMEVDEEGSVPARAAWPWAVFTVALGAGIVLFFVYPPR